MESKLINLFVAASTGPTPALTLAPTAGRGGAHEGRQPGSDKLFWPYPERVGSLAGGGGRGGSVKRIGSDGRRAPDRRVDNTADLDPCSIRDRWILRSAVDDEGGHWRERRRTVRPTGPRPAPREGRRPRFVKRGRVTSCARTADPSPSATSSQARSVAEHVSRGSIGT